MLVVFKDGSSVLAVVACTIRLPLVDILLLWPFLAGVAYVPSITVYDWCALVALILGTSIYKYVPEGKSPNINDEEEQEMLISELSSMSTASYDSLIGE